jgi:hypothetical protein
LLEKDKQLVFVNNIKLIIGLNFCSELQLYLFKKSTFDLLEKDKQLVFVNNIKLIIGLNFCSELQLYLFKKSPDHKLIKYL